VLSKAAASMASKPTATASLAGPGRFARGEADHVGEDAVQRVGLRDLQHQVAELQSMLHARSLLVGGWLVTGKSRSVLARRESSRPGCPASRAAAVAAAGSGVNG
jgi:hypothetical protein